MSGHEPRTLGFYASSHWMQGVMVLLILGGLALILLSALDEMKERAEKQLVELTIRNMRTGLQLAMAEALMHQQASGIAEWAGSNPVRWLGSLPDGYRGECSAAQRKALSGGEWCFEQERRELVYRLRHDGHLSPPVDEAGRVCADLSWRVAGLSESGKKDGFVGLRLKPASSCRWRLDSA